MKNEFDAVVTNDEMNCTDETGMDNKTKGLIGLAGVGLTALGTAVYVKKIKPRRERRKELKEVARLYDEGRLAVIDDENETTE